jgi:hypothetical protein
MYIEYNTTIPSRNIGSLQGSFHLTISGSVFDIVPELSYSLYFFYYCSSPVYLVLGYLVDSSPMLVTLGVTFMDAVILV